MASSNAFGKSRSFSKSVPLLLVLLLILSTVFAIVSGRRKKDLKGVTLALHQALTNNGYAQRMVTYWVAITQFETANLTSRLFTQANNLVGMRIASKRMQTRSGEYDAGSNGKFAAYSSIDQAAGDLALYLNYFKYAKDYPNIDFLIGKMKDEGYFGNESYDTYLAGVKRYLK